MIDLDALEEAAKKATPGPWEAESFEESGTVEVSAGSARTDWKDVGDGLMIGARPGSYLTTDRIVERDDLYDTDFEVAVADTEFIAAANPAVILEWVAAHREALAKIEAVKTLHRNIIGESEFWTPNDNQCGGGCREWPCATVRALTEGETSEHAD